MTMTPEQIAEVKAEMVANGLPVRFLVNGRALNLSTGELQQKGINVIHQMCYWNFTRETSKKIAKWLNATPIFDKST